VSMICYFLGSRPKVNRIVVQDMQFQDRDSRASRPIPRPRLKNWVLRRLRWSYSVAFQSVCQSDARRRCDQTAERNELLFRAETSEDPRRILLDEGLDIRLRNLVKKTQASAYNMVQTLFR